MKWPWKRTEERATTMTQRDLSLVEVLGGDQHFGQIVSAVTTEWLSAASASIDAIAGTIATLPAYVYRRTEAGREEDDAHPLARIIRDGPNDHQSWPDFLTWLVAETLRHGNGVAELVRDGAGRLVGLEPMPYDRRTIMLLPSGRLAYDFTEPATLQRRRLLDGEALHLRDRSDDGRIGRARHERASPVIAAALALAKHSGALFENGMYPGLSVQLDGRINEEGVTRIKAQLESLFKGPQKSGKAIIIPQAGKVEPLSVSPVDGEILAARRFAQEEAARVYGVPQPIVGILDHGCFANVNDLLRYWAMGCVSQWARKIEAEFHRSALSDTGRRTHMLEIDVSGLLRGDPQQRWAGHKIAVEARILTPNEVRLVEGWNPREGGDGFEEAAGSGGGGAGA